MSRNTGTPLVAVPCDTRRIGKHVYHMAGEGYLEAVRGHAGAVPVLVPAARDPLDTDDILSWADGVLFTGAVTNVHPAHYGVNSWRLDTVFDRQRDMTALPLIRAAIDQGVPILCICRGIQELNVALGGTLHQHVQDVDGRFDHRETRTDHLDVQYGPAHTVDVVPGGVLHGILGGASAVRVNSLHGQGIDRLADGLAVEAAADDGTIEAVSLPSAASYVLGVQWHPEWEPARNPHYRAILASFGEAVRARGRGSGRERYA